LGKGFVTPKDFRLNILTEPSYMSISCIPLSARPRIIDRWTNYLELIEKHFNISPDYNKTTSGYKSVITALKQTPYIDQRAQFFHRAMHLDAVRTENLYAVYPELEFILKED
ncbi:MAG: hypothetical protein K2P92_00830, partial [Bdellovibrionaceae bacterium]|nr:hypothetical protein [Pseudobdellovibrionaceae bacterium]